MAKKKKNKDDQSEGKKKMVDLDKLKSLGIIKGDAPGGIEEVDGSNITGGKKEGEDTTVDTHWPTTADL